MPSFIVNGKELCLSSKDLEERIYIVDPVTGETSIRVTAAAGYGAPLNGIKWDYVKATYPNTTTEVFTFRDGGSGGAVTRVITITYLAADKEDIDEVTVA